MLKTELETQVNQMILNYPLKHNNPLMKNLTGMENGLSFKIGPSAHLLVEVENNSFKESASPLAELVNLVKKVLKFLQEHVMSKIALHLKLKKLKN